MDNVIRPIFGRQSETSSTTVEDFKRLRIYGIAVGHFVALIRTETGGEGMTLQIIVGQEGAQGAKAVAIFPDDADSEADAEATAFAILRSLEIVKEAMLTSS